MNSLRFCSRSIIRLFVAALPIMFLFLTNCWSTAVEKDDLFDPVLQEGKPSPTLKGYQVGTVIDSLSISFDGKLLACTDKKGRLYVFNIHTGKRTIFLEPKPEDKGEFGAWFCDVVFCREKNLFACFRMQTNMEDKLEIRDAETGKFLRILKDSSMAGGMLNRGDGKFLVACDPQNDVDLKIWDWTTDKPLHSIKLNQKYRQLGLGESCSVSFPADGKMFATGELYGPLQIWDMQTGKLVHKLIGNKAKTSDLAFSPDGQTLAAANTKGLIRLWDAAKGTLKASYQVDARGAIEAGGNAILQICFSPDGKTLFSCGFEETICRFDLATGKKLPDIKTGEALSCLVSSPDGTRLFSAGDGGTIRQWDMKTGAEDDSPKSTQEKGQEMLTLKGHTGEVLSVAFSGDGKRLASASYDQTVKVWDATSGQEMFTLQGHTSEVNSVAFSPDGKRLASASNDQTVKVWDATSGQEMFTLQGHTSEVRSVAFSADGKRLASASGDNTVKVWDATSGQETLTLKGHTSEVLSVAFSGDGKRLASASNDKTVKVWDATSGQETFTLKGHTGEVLSVAFSADGKRLASASEDQTVKVWDAQPLTPEPK